MSRPADRFFAGRETLWNQLLDTIEAGEGRDLGQGESERLYYIFSTFLPERQSAYPHDMSRLEVWYERQQAFMDLQAYVEENYNGDYDLSDFIDDESDWRQNYEQIPA